jgi:hypothetical protein
VASLAVGSGCSGIRIAGGIATRGQKDVLILYSNFDREIESIKAEVPQLSDSEVLLRVMRLIAIAHVAHNYGSNTGRDGVCQSFACRFCLVPGQLRDRSSNIGLHVNAGFAGFDFWRPENRGVPGEPEARHFSENDAELHQQASSLKMLVSDIAAPLNIADFLAGSDPVRDATLHAQ